ncbi:ribosomal protection-like ABC-F family protein [Parapedobacter lycopersici]|uniref:ribosomal protection-like ABC-F family protein n=1 Tax=Parapedobacter lycopersici TaxID=1864939 RepID=UPI00214D7318|nr:ABC-F family ATP-binding cassette domain-containing protein [Parapedobacter lycopersici]
MLTLQHITYLHPDKTLLFDDISLSINQREKVALIGNNGCGKSTLLKIIAGELQPAGGQLDRGGPLYYMPQVFGQYNELTVAQSLGIADKWNALNEILNGNVTEANLELLDDDWTIEERCAEALQHWQLGRLDLAGKMETLSGGQKTRVFLAGIFIHRPQLILLDEPSNHLDMDGRRLLYDFIRNTSSTLLVVSHDRKLLNLLDTVMELHRNGVTVYGGNYDAYAEQKQLASEALNQDIRNREKALRKAKEKERETLERQQKLDARGKQKHEKAGVARIMMNTLRNHAESSTAKIKGVHAEKIGNLSQELHELRATVSDTDKMKIGFDGSALHRGKRLFAAEDVNVRYCDVPLWATPMTFQLASGERVVLKGANGSGKTTLIKLVLGDLEPASGIVYRATGHTVYVDQDYSLIDNRLSVYEQAQRFNTGALQEHEIKTRLSRLLFPEEDWNKPCSALSGGEKMRLTLCCLTIQQLSPDIIVLDEPTNNLDIQSVEILVSAINAYQGTLIVVSHDDYFIEQLRTDRVIALEM